MSLMPSVDDILAWEEGSMDSEREAGFFQGLIDSGLAWRLQGVYGRRAMDLIEAGECRPANRG